MDTTVATLQELLCAHDREDLANLLVRATSRIEPTTTYGAQWHSFLATFILEVPPDIYIALRTLAADDYDLICQCIKDLYPPQESDVEINGIVLHVQKSLDARESRRRSRLKQLALSWLKRAQRLHEFSQQHYRLHHFAEAISASQECIELSVKALCITILHAYPKQHDITDTEARNLVMHAPHLIKDSVPKLFLYVRFWRGFYALAKYGHEGLLVGPEKLFGSAEADLAYQHAKDCLTLVLSVVPSAESLHPAQSTLNTLELIQSDDTKIQTAALQHSRATLADTAPEPP